MSHTPGPWKLSAGRNKHYRDAVEGVDYEATAQRCWIVESETARRNFVADVITSNSPTGEANARLIANAPAQKTSAALLHELVRLLLPDRKHGCLCDNCLREEITIAARLEAKVEEIRSKV